MDQLDAKRGSWGNPEAYIPTGSGSKVSAGVKALGRARDQELEALKIRLRSAVIPAGAPQQPPQDLAQQPLMSGPGGSPPLTVAALTASLANVHRRRCTGSTGIVRSRQKCFTEA
eukprot:6620031-Prymnesium_polylepis.1